MLAGLNLLLAALCWGAPANAAKIACVGDSITYGYGLSDPSNESYPAVLQELLGSEHMVENFGVSGATLLKSGDRPYWNEASYAASDSFGPTVVVLMLGTNDAKPQNWANSSAFATDYQELIEHYRGLGAVVYVATPPTVFEPGAFDISPGVLADEVVPLVEQIAVEADAPLIDIFEATNSSSNLFPDTVHPNAAGARLLAETVEAALVLNDFDASGDGGTGGSGAQTSSSNDTAASTGAGGLTSGVGTAAQTTVDSGNASVSGTSVGGQSSAVDGSSGGGATSVATTSASATTGSGPSTSSGSSTISGTGSGGGNQGQATAQSTTGIPAEGGSASPSNDGCSCRMPANGVRWTSGLVLVLLSFASAMVMRRAL